MTINPNKLQQVVLSIGLALFLIIGANIRSGASTIAFFLFLLSCFWLYKHQYNAIKLNKQEKIWLFSVVMLNIVVLLSSYDGNSIDWSSIDSLTRFLFAIPVYFLVRQIGIDLGIILLGAGIGVILLGIYAWYQIELLGFSQARGMTDHNYFGQLSVLLTFFSFCGFAFSQNKLLKWVFAIAIVAGMYAILAANSRGAWIAIPAIILLMMKYDAFQVSQFKKIITLTAFIALIATLYLNNIFSVKDRVDIIINETIDYFQKDEVRGSGGFRLEMWRASLIIAKDSYGLGAGDKGYTKGVKSLLKQNKIHPSLKIFTVEPHNYYLKTLVSQGIIGIILLLIMLFIPVKIFFSNVTHSKESKLNSILGIGVIIAYMDFMLSNTTLDVQLMTVFLGFILFPLLGNVSFQNKETIEQISYV